MSPGFLQLGWEHSVFLFLFFLVDPVVPILL
jgi:hypothetical protein